jgi:hypothetical protein
MWALPLRGIPRRGGASEARRTGMSPTRATPVSGLELYLPVNIRPCQHHTILSSRPAPSYYLSFSFLFFSLTHYYIYRYLYTVCPPVQLPIWNRTYIEFVIYNVRAQTFFSTKKMVCVIVPFKTLALAHKRERLDLHWQIFFWSSALTNNLEFLFLIYLEASSFWYSFHKRVSFMLYSICNHIYDRKSLY